MTSATAARRRLFDRPAPGPSDRARSWLSGRGRPRRHPVEVDRTLPALLDAVTRSLRAGASVPVALHEAASTSSAAADELAQVLAAADQGVPLSSALDAWAARCPTAGVRLTAGALAVAVQTGGAPARALDGVASTLRQRQEVDREARALATQARLSALVVTVAPLAFAALGLLGDAGAPRFLLGTGPGRLCLLAGVGLDALGAWWMARLTRSPS